MPFDEGSTEGESDASSSGSRTLASDSIRKERPLDQEPSRFFPRKLPSISLLLIRRSRIAFQLVGVQKMLFANRKRRVGIERTRTRQRLTLCTTRRM